jgi:hypothetical protein
VNDKKGSAFNLYVFQLKVLPILLAWAAGSMITGAFWLRSTNLQRRGMGAQFFGWGLIDGLIAAWGLRHAAQNARRLKQGEIQVPEHNRQSRQFEAFVWANAALDFGYILGGRWLVNRYPHDEGKLGMGQGIILQGTFLMVWDVLLAAFVHKKQRYG